MQTLEKATVAVAARIHKALILIYAYLRELIAEILELHQDVEPGVHLSIRGPGLLGAAHEHLVGQLE